MNKIISYISDTELENEFYRDVRDRYIDQKFLYQGEDSVDGYYNLEHEHVEEVEGGSDYSEYTKVIEKLLVKNTRSAFISLGCGNASIEKNALKQALSNGYSITYVGVDTSLGMLEEAKKNLEDLPIDKVFLQIDMIDDRFKEKIAAATQECDNRIFAFIGGTLANVNQTNIADSMYNILEKNDYLWVDVRIRPDTNMETNMKIFNRYERYVYDGTERWWFIPLEKIGVPFTSGKMNMKMVYEHSVGALHFMFYFTFTEKVVVHVDGNTIHFLPNEEVKLQTIRVYHPETLKNFFKEHEFNLVLQEIDGEDGQFIFKK
jgi:hypothetical protein